MLHIHQKETMRRCHGWRQRSISRRQQVQHEAGRESSPSNCHQTPRQVTDLSVQKRIATKLKGNELTGLSRYKTVTSMMSSTEQPHARKVIGLCVHLNVPEMYNR
jgi:hypothetical protein